MLLILASRKVKGTEIEVRLMIRRVRKARRGVADQRHMCENITELGLDPGILLFTHYTALITKPNPP